MKYVSPGLYRLEPNDHVIGDRCYVCGRHLALGELVVITDTGDGEVVAHDHRPSAAPRDDDSQESSMSIADGFELIGPFTAFPESEVVLNGYTVPIITAHENDGGTVTILVDHRLAYTVPAGEAENVIRLVADALACALGYMAHPSGGHQPSFEHVPHPLLAPQRVHSIGGVQEADGETPDDPRLDHVG